MLWKFELCRKFLVHWGIIACIGIIAYIRMLQLCFENFELCRKLWVYWGATILIARGLLFSSRLGPGSFAFHKVIYSRLQPFTASPLEMTLWNPSGPSAAMPRAAANTVCWQMDEVFLPQFNSLLKLLKFSMGNGHFASIICTQSISTPIQGIVLFKKL